MDTADELLRHYREKLRAVERRKSRELLAKSPPSPGMTRVIYDEDRAIFVDYLEGPKGKFPVRAFVMTFSVLALWKIWVEADLGDLPVRRKFIVETGNEIMGYDLIADTTIQRSLSHVRNTPFVHRDHDGVICFRFRGGLQEVRDSCWRFTKNWLFSTETLRTVGRESFGIESAEEMESEITSLEGPEFCHRWFWELNDLAGNRVSAELRRTRR